MCERHHIKRQYSSCNAQLFVMVNDQLIKEAIKEN